MIYYIPHGATRNNILKTDLLAIKYSCCNSSHLNNAQMMKILPKVGEELKHGYKCLGT